MTKNTRKKLIPAIIVAGILAIAALVVFQLRQPRQDDRLPVTLSAIQTNNGWGYEIYVDGKIFIKQVSLPAISGERGFKSKEQALAVGNLAVQKIVRGKMPSISIEELKSLKAL